LAPRSKAAILERRKTAMADHVKTPNELAQEKRADEQSMQDATKLSSRLIYEVIRRDGEEELERPTRSLVWSGVAAGIMISFSVLGEAIFRTYLPDTPSSYLIENLGYSLGFLLVILGRMQLFTENGAADRAIVGDCFDCQCGRRVRYRNCFRTHIGNST
jgi:hypothetical protein